MCRRLLISLTSRSRLVALGSEAHVIAKVETKSAISDEYLEEIVRVSDGIMVARGDLAVEAGAEIVPVIQRRIVALCRKHGKLVIVATQMMGSMVDHPEPTRAEVSDVANAVIQGSDVVMLSDETANGNYPVETVQAMQKPSCTHRNTVKSWRSTRTRYAKRLMQRLVTRRYDWLRILMHARLSRRRAAGQPQLISRHFVLTCRLLS